ncbi:hypothetical protein [Zobellella denitrificans]|nr:hypothetical protein [Zobellella denitrificans]
MIGLLPPAIADRWDLPERNLLLYDGISTLPWMRAARFGWSD